MLFFFCLLSRFFIASIFSPLTFRILACHFANYLLAIFALSTASVRFLNNSSLILINYLLSFVSIALSIALAIASASASLCFITFFRYFVFFLYFICLLPRFFCASNIYLLFSYYSRPLQRSKLDLVVKAISSAATVICLDSLGCHQFSCDCVRVSNIEATRLLLSNWVNSRRVSVYACYIECGERARKRSNK